MIFERNDRFYCSQNGSLDIQAFDLHNFQLISDVFFYGLKKR